ncbi:hypothetical protein CAPTEDRAFT_225745 [Capitella teleta]|uniref:MARVEL domain-containing protein n=1 Tax=Capitella teleta TaxID=283909 RepID=R7VKJ1_CAPTE|nr:hypothetical protein CAPTEDRAFT_225745 [Capitella teleta]|eukprot:ELU17416.1 hypothetical protein CAPTEDRAFT_225745 [Capitella teleta]
MAEKCEETITMPVAVHTINFRGLAGGIFISISLAVVLYVIGFATVGWAVARNHEGLWQSCSCGKISNAPDWFVATQAMITIGLIGVLLAFILVAIYMCVHSVSKNTTLIALVVVCFLTVIFTVIGLGIYGSKREDTVSWSFAMTCVAGILTLIGGILSIFQMRSSGVQM